jgi:ABC-type dipeptide/oligopeptide/nickel transport system ATPase component
VLCDEPTSSLDTSAQVELLHQLRQLVTITRTALLFVTHDLSIVPLVTDHVVVLDAGRIVEQPAADDLAAGTHPATTALLNALPRPRWLAPPT